MLPFTESHTTSNRFRSAGCPQGYDAALARKRPVNPLEDLGHLQTTWADWIGERIGVGHPQVVFTFTPRPWGYSDTPVYPAKVVQGDESLWYPRTQHGRPQFCSIRKAKELRGQVFEAIRQIQGYRPDWLCFTELQDNGNPHFHGVLSNVNLTHKAFEPVVIKKDPKGRRHIVFIGAEGIAWDIMGQASFRLYGGADGDLTVGHYFAKDMLRTDKGRPEIEASPLWGKRRKRAQELDCALELNRKVWGGLASFSSVDTGEGLDA